MPPWLLVVSNSFINRTKQYLSHCCLFFIFLCDLNRIDLYKKFKDAVSLDPPAFVFLSYKAIIILTILLLSTWLKTRFSQKWFRGKNSTTFCLLWNLCWHLCKRGIWVGGCMDYWECKLSVLAPRSVKKLGFTFQSRKHCLAVHSLISSSKCSPHKTIFLQNSLPDIKQLFCNLCNSISPLKTVTVLKYDWIGDKCDNYRWKLFPNVRIGALLFTNHFFCNGFWTRNTWDLTC